MNGTRTLADVIFDQRGARLSPALTMEQPSPWRYMATGLMADMGAYTPHDLNQLHWRWLHMAALCIRDALLRHHVQTIRTPLH